MWSSLVMLSFHVPDSEIRLYPEEEPMLKAPVALFPLMESCVKSRTTVDTRFVVPSLEHPPERRQLIRNTKKTTTRRHSTKPAVAMMLPKNLMARHTRAGDAKA